MTGVGVYPHRPDLAEKKFWVCKPCDAYVGCHPGTIKPLGRLADAQLRTLKRMAHAEFDPIWKDGLITRGQAYSWLAGELGMEKSSCHIGEFSEERCIQVIKACKKFKGALHG
jgi:hypothetical protein